MSAGEATARKPTNSRDTAIAAIRALLVQFRKETNQWEREVEELFGEMESAAVQALLENASVPPSSQPFAEMVAVQQELSRQQEAAAAEMARLRQVVEGQWRLLQQLIPVESPVECEATPVLET